MERLKEVIQQMIRISEEELSDFLGFCYEENYPKKSIICGPGSIPDEIFFLEKGIIRVMITDPKGKEHSLHFTLENQFICDYTQYLLRRPSIYTLECLEDSKVVVLPRKAIDWGYENLKEGQKFGRLIAEFYFIYLDTRINDQYSLSSKERYDNINKTFPNIHNRVSQHMIASYLGISSVHLSRLKKEDKLKI
ncbi:MAG: cyclic nucleotide-binding domain-containing protein [Bacteroidia bacterium]|nr:cyclic nucleotide-binding domain-containing protein [Bacteroidia bacterium]